MIGQGSPEFVCVCCKGRGNAVAAKPLLWLLTLCAMLACVQAVAAPPKPLDLRLRVAWGGGTARVWQGQLSASASVLTKLTYLGVDADQAATIYLDKAGSSSSSSQVIRIAQRSPVQYTGFDFTVAGMADSVLTIELTPLDRSQEIQKYEVPLSALITGDFQQPLDEQNNRLVIQRTGGDRIRVAFTRSSLVFAPAEAFQFTVEPHELGIQGPTTLRCVARLTRARGGAVLTEQEQEISLDMTSEPPRKSFTFSTPHEEGVYELMIALYRPRFADAIMRRGPLHWRKIQFVVVGEAPTPEVSGKWELLESIDPNHASWMEWLTHIPKLPLLPDFRQEPLGNGKSATWKHLDHDLVELQPGGWQAYPLSIQRTGMPHVLEVEYPSDVAQTLGISIIEPNATGQVIPIELDSGVDVAPRWDVTAPRMLRHRLFFWPRTKAPLVLLTNRRTKTRAVFGTIQIHAGPQELPPLANSTNDQSAPAGARLLAVYFDKPLFPEQFCASEAADLTTGQSLDDWITFYESGRRLVQYLKHTGYNGAILSVANQGSTLYPSEILDPNPQYDTGAFFATGQDPVRKDVLEMLFRLFDRAGLTLVPAVQFSSPIASLERLRRTTPQAAVGIDLVDARQQDWLTVHGAQRGMAPYYNPLDPRVQAAMRNVLAEITNRYAKHAAFGGLAMQLEPDSFATLPGGIWGQDPVTRDRFERQLGYKPNDGEPISTTGFRTRDRHAAWLAWRAETLANFHKAIAGDLTKQAANARLLLMTGNLFTASVARELLRPSLPNRVRINDAMLELGLDASRYADTPSVVFFRPDRINSNETPAPRSDAINLSYSADSDRYFAQAGTAAALFFHEPRPVPIPSFDRASPFGIDKTHVVLVTHVTPSSVENRRRFVQRMATSDIQVLADGGWMLPLGQEDSIRPLLRTLRDLPAEPFTDVAPHATGLPTQPLMVRSLHWNGKTYVYVVNPSPWAVTAELDIQSTGPVVLQPLGDRTMATPTPIGTQQTWTLDLSAYDIAAAVFADDHVEISTWRATLDREAFTRLRQEVTEMRSRANALNHAPQLGSLSNPGFELKDDPLSGWIHRRGDGVTTEVDDKNAFAGEHSLKISSTGPVAWVRSEPFKPPTTGRISVIVRLRTDNPDEQPPLRFVVEGRRNDGTTYFKHADDVGAGNKRLTKQWSKQPFMLHISDLPTDELVDVRVGFDLLGKGTVWIDDIQVYDLWFLPNERDELTIMSALATMSLNKGQTADCLRVLEGFWPRFLNAYVKTQPIRTAALPADAPPSGPAIPAPQAKPSVLDKVRSRLPKRVFPFQSSIR